KLLSSHYPFQVIYPVSSMSKEFLVKSSDQQVWRMLDFVENSITFLKVPSIKIAYEAAKTFSLFLNTVNVEPLPEIKDTLPGFINFEKRISDYNNALENTSADVKEKAKDEIQYMNALLSLPEKWIHLQNNHLLPKRIIHADPKISNILFHQDHSPLAVIDLDTVMTSTVLYDFGDMIRSYTNTTNEDEVIAGNNFNPEIFKAVKEGFLFHLQDKLAPEEYENLDYAAQVVIYIQAVRFLTDYLNGNIYYSVTYPEHNLHRTKNQLQLLKGLRAYLEEI
ncbi:phosphotransferase, partial [Chryseobacterium sp. Alg-005]|uniref:phosphotransferase n=1 Tax=Chryseobacterium sp. Alg-005 TaxID=3159516 RepID=UPI0036F3D888